ncbi:unnamed protein product [Clavelina lepadiformis]|uniref:Uncharacterized protein n=1 Tax=Clavelina lepadiformis TaxID=159417 RepID=A0ABP0FT77_CLALP
MAREHGKVSALDQSPPNIDHVCLYFILLRNNGAVTNLKENEHIDALGNDDVTKDVAFSERSWIDAKFLSCFLQQHFSPR